jgi:FkbM family methyltransferase
MGALKTFGRKMFSPFLGKKNFQIFFELFHEFSLAGMNAGEGRDPNTSGEYNAIRYIKKNLGSSSRDSKLVLFDVGANIGEYSQVLLNEFTESAVVWSFEPSPTTYQILTKNIGDQPNFKPQNIGCGSQEMVTELYTLGAGSKMASLYSRELTNMNDRMTKFETVNIRTIDQFCFEQGIEHIHFLKIDVEGHEFQVLLGAQKMLAKKAINFIQFEMGVASVDSHIFLKDFYLLLNHRFTMHRILKDGLWPLNKYKESQEIYKYATNYLAVLLNQDV